MCTRWALGENWMRIDISFLLGTVLDFIRSSSIYEFMVEKWNMWKYVRRAAFVLFPVPFVMWLAPTYCTGVNTSTKERMVPSAASNNVCDGFLTIKAHSYSRPTHVKIACLQIAVHGSFLYCYCVIVSNIYIYIYVFIRTQYSYIHWCILPAHVLVVVSEIVFHLLCHILVTSPF